MAYLPTQPFTVIGKRLSNNSNEKECKEESSFVPPSSTWYDESHQHFVALLDRSFMIGSTTVDSNEVFFYQTFKLPISASEVDCENNYDHFNSTSNSMERCFTPSSLYPIILPLRVCRRLSVNSRTGGNSNNQQQNSSSLSESPVRIPLLVKFSLDSTLMVLQLSDKILKIVVVIPIRKDYNMMTFLTPRTINMSILPQSIVDGKQQQWIVNLTKEDMYIKANSSTVINDSTRILPGGVIWSDHGGSSQDLILITNTAVLFYKISISRNQLAKSRTYTHSSDAFWYEATTRTLLVATFPPKTTQHNETSKHRITLRTYFLRMNENSSSSTASYILPRLNLPPPDLLPLFHVDINCSDQNDNWNDIKNDWLNNVILLVKLYDEMYCIHIQPNEQKKIAIYHLDKIGRCAQLVKMLMIPMQPSSSDNNFNNQQCTSNICPYFITTLDNILCLHCKKRNISFFYDIASSQDPIFQGEFIVNCPDFYQKYQILSPNLYLDPQHRGKIFIPHLDLKRISSSIPLPSPSVIPFLLRRHPSSMELAHSIALYRLNCMITTQTPLSIIKSACLTDVVDIYFKSNKDHNVVLGWDMEACIPLIFQCVLLPRQQQQQSDNHPDIDWESEVTLEQYLESVVSSICPHPPLICKRILTQVQIIEKVLLSLAVSTLRNHSTLEQREIHDKLKFIADVACLFMSMLFRNSTSCCVALECLIVAIYWKLGHGNRAMSFLSSCHSYRHYQTLIPSNQDNIRGMHNTTTTTNTMDYSHDNPILMDVHQDPLYNGSISHTAATASNRSAIAPSAEVNAVSSSDAILAFAKMLLIMATDVPLGNIGLASNQNSNTNTNKTYYKNALINFSIDLMCFNSSEYQVAAKHLLDLGRVMEAIFLCTNVLQQQKQQQASSHLRSNINHDSYHMNHFYNSPCKGNEAVDFFKAAIDCAAKMTDIGDRSRLFYHLYTFFSQYDPESITTHKSIKLIAKRESINTFMDFNINSTSLNVDANNHDSDIITNANKISTHVVEAVAQDDSIHDEDVANATQAISTKSITSRMEKSLLISSPSPKSSIAISSNTVAIIDNHSHEDDTLLQNSSPLAMSVPNFPDDLFDGKGNSVSNTIRRIFGFPILYPHS